MLVNIPLDDSLATLLLEEINRAIRLEVAGVEEAPMCVKTCYMLLLSAGYVKLNPSLFGDNHRGIDAGIQEQDTP